MLKSFGGSLRELSHRLHQGTRCNHVHHEDFAEEPVPAQSSICRCVQGHGKPFKSLCTTCPATVSAAFPDISRNTKRTRTKAHEAQRQCLFHGNMYPSPTSDKQPLKPDSKATEATRASSLCPTLENRTGAPCGFGRRGVAIKANSPSANHPHATKKTVLNFGTLWVFPPRFAWCRRRPWQSDISFSYRLPPSCLLSTCVAPSESVLLYLRIQCNITCTPSTVAASSNSKPVQHLHGPLHGIRHA